MQEWEPDDFVPWGSCYGVEWVRVGPVEAVIPLRQTGSKLTV
jgi:hypothetical protein